MLWIKTFHLLAVISWLACVFVTPRVLVLCRQAMDDQREVYDLKQLALKLYRFGVIMLVFTLIFGGLLWLYYGISGGWLMGKLLLVGLLMGYYLYLGYLLWQLLKHNVSKSTLFLRITNEVSVLMVIPILYFAVAKPALFQ